MRDEAEKTEAPKKVGRRRFLQWLGVSGAGVATASVCVLPKPERVEAEVIEAIAERKQPRDKCPTCGSRDREECRVIGDIWAKRIQMELPIYCVDEWHDEVAVAFAEGYTQCATKRL